MPAITGVAFPVSCSWERRTPFYTARKDAVPSTRKTARPPCAVRTW